MKSTLILASALGASAFPGMRRGIDGIPHEIRSLYADLEGSDLVKRQEDALGISRAQSNCGTRLCPTFDEQGMHQYSFTNWSDGH